MPVTPPLSRLAVEDVELATKVRSDTMSGNNSFPSGMIQSGAGDYVAFPRDFWIEEINHLFAS